MAALSQTENSNFRRVLIIGGGIAGISAANHLVKCGCTDFLLLEATGKLGGRVEAVESGIYSFRSIHIHNKNKSENFTAFLQIQKKYRYLPIIISVKSTKVYSIFLP